MSDSHVRAGVRSIRTPGAPLGQNRLATSIPGARLTFKMLRPPQFATRNF